MKKLKLVIVMVKSFDKYHHLFSLHILVTILFFNDWDSSIPYSAGMIAWNINFSLPHFSSIPSNLALLQLPNQNFDMVSWGINFPLSFYGPIFLWLSPHMTILKSPRNLYAIRSPINMTTMITQHTKFPPTPRSSRKIWSRGYSLSLS